MKYYGDVHALRLQSKSLKGESHEGEGCREQREAPVHRLKDVIEEQRYGGYARNRDVAPCVIQPAANKELGRMLPSAG